MRLRRELLDRLLTHAVSTAPLECCGLIAGRGGEPVKIYPADNMADSELRFEIDGYEQFTIQASIEQAGLELLAVYHSHTHAAPYPSATDIALGTPSLLQVIIGLAGPVPLICAYRIVDGEVSPG